MPRERWGRRRGRPWRGGGFSEAQTRVRYDQEDISRIPKGAGEIFSEISMLVLQMFIYSRYGAVVEAPVVEAEVGEVLVAVIGIAAACAIVVVVSAVPEVFVAVTVAVVAVISAAVVVAAVAAIFVVVVETATVCFCCCFTCRT